MRRQLLLLSAASTTLVLIAFMIPLALLLRTLAEDRAVGQALQEAQGLAVVAAVVVDPLVLDPLVQLTDQNSPREVSVVLTSRQVLGTPLADGSRALELAAQGNAFTVVVAEGREIFVPVQSVAGLAVVRVFVPASLLRRGVATALRVLGLLAVVLLVLTLAVADRLARGTVRPVRALADTTNALATGELDARLEPDGPKEVREAGVAVNQLGGRIAELVAAEREAVADLSHRLRTPLTALRLQAGNLSSPQEAASVDAAVQALENAVSEVIRVARRPLRLGGQEPCDAAEVLRRRAQFWQVLAEDQDRPWSIDVAATELRVAVDAEALSAALDVLLENVFAHIPDGSAVEVSARPEGDMVQLEVADRGPGLAPSASRRGRSGTGSTGLGLDIARRTAEDAGGRLLLSERPAGGARVALVLPRVF